MCASVSVTAFKLYYADLVYSCTGDDTLLLCITSLRQKMVQDESVVPIEVRRDFVLLDALREAHKKKFDPRKYLKVSCAATLNVTDMCYVMLLTSQYPVLVYLSQAFRCVFMRLSTCRW